MTMLKTCKETMMSTGSNNRIFASSRDFQPDLQVSFNTEETMKQRLQKRVLKLAKKITETSKNLEQMEDQFQSLSLKSSPKKSEIIE